MARSGSLPYVFVLGLFTFGLIGALWGLLDTAMVDMLIQQSQWSSGSSQAMLIRQYIRQSWNALLLIVVLGIGVEAIVASRLDRVPSGNLAVRSFGLFSVHLLLVLWAFVFPTAIDPVMHVAQNTSAIGEAGFSGGYYLTTTVAYTYVPGMILVAADVFYLLAPIRSDTYGGYA